MSRSFSAYSDLPLPFLNGFDLVPLRLMRRQSEPDDATVVSENVAGVKPLAAFGAAVDPVPIRNHIFLVTPITPRCRQCSTFVRNACKGGSEE